MMSIDVLWPLLAVLFVATFIRSAFGFGEALVAVPLLALFMPVEVAAPVAVLVSMTVATVVLVQDWRHADLRSAGRLFLATLPGLPLGLWLLTHVSSTWVKALLGAIIIGFSGYVLAARHPPLLKNDRHAWLFGFGGGILGGAYGMNGPPLVLYGTLRRWSPQHFRATLQGYFLPASVLVMVGYALTGLWTSTVTRDYLVSLPVVAVAIVLGRIANRRMNAKVFVRCVHVGLIATGTVLLLQSLTH
ncbi:MAG TPA: sulfite exporter TauE/SafE family protein [Oleiagrimonas sp.]|nr:sulfite exporter TauE/SafE family protein [Oleiagrimonas sp.]